MNKKKRFELLCHHTHEILFDGWFDTIKDCVEAAIADNICLDGVDLSGMNLACANLDDAQMAGAILNGTNFNGANLSEGVFDNSDMRMADLSHACLALSSLMNVNMMGASFAITDVTDAIISGCNFSCPSVFTTLFSRAAIFKNCLFIHPDHGALTISKPPVIVQGLSRDIVYLDHCVKIGNDYISKIDIAAAGDRHLEFIYGREVAAFIRPVLYENFVNL